MKGSARLEGGADLAKALSQLSARVSTRLLRESLVESAEPMQERMSELAPFDPEDPPTHLREEIVVQVIRGEDRREVAVAVGPSKRAFYGGLQEFGTAHHAAQPFARPAFDQTWLQSMQILSSSLWRELAGRGINRPTVSAPTTVQDEV